MLVKLVFHVSYILHLQVHWRGAAVYHTDTLPCSHSLMLAEDWGTRERHMPWSCASRQHAL